MVSRSFEGTQPITLIVQPVAYVVFRAPCTPLPVPQDDFLDPTVLYSNLGRFFIPTSPPFFSCSFVSVVLYLHFLSSRG